MRQHPTHPPQTLADTPATAMAQAAATVAASPPVGALPPPPTLIDCILRDHSNTLTLFSYFFKVLCPAAAAGRQASCVRSTVLVVPPQARAACCVAYLLQATSLGDAAVQDMTASALALDLRLHSHVRLLRVAEPAWPAFLLAACFTAGNHNATTIASGAGRHAARADEIPIAAQDFPCAAAAAATFLCLQAETVVLYPILQSRLGPSGAQWATRALAVGCPAGLQPQEGMLLLPTHTPSTPFADVPDGKPCCAGVPDGKPCLLPDGKPCTHSACPAGALDD